MITLLCLILMALLCFPIRSGVYLNRAHAVQYIGRADKPIIGKFITNVGIWAAMLVFGMLVSSIFSSNLLTCMIAGFVLWLPLFVFTLPLFVFLNRGLQGTVLEDRFFNWYPKYRVEEVEEEGVHNGKRVIIIRPVLHIEYSNLEEDSQKGLRLKFPFQSVFKKVDMAREIKSESKMETKYPTKNKHNKSINLTANWFLAIRPLAGYLVNYVENHTDEAEDNDVEKVFRAKTERFLHQYIISFEDDEEVMENLGAMSHEFRRQNGGEEYIDALEIRYGVWTGTPQLFGIDREPAVQDALSAGAKLAALRQNAREMVAESGGTLDYAEALIEAEVAAGYRQGVSSHVNWKDIPDNVSAIALTGGGGGGVVGGIVGGGGSGGNAGGGGGGGRKNRKNKKNGNT
ncbi:MAG TPA: hypothetical protein VJH55_04010 [Candidatus Paceibacterota bacterium]